MRFEEVLTIWETQEKRPVFAFNDFGLHLALYQTRDRARRHLFWGSYFPFFVGSLFMVGAFAVVTLSFLLQGQEERFPLSLWDALASLVAAIALALCASSMYASRRNHENAQSVFAPSLRQEIERGIGQVEFEILTHTGPSAWRNVIVCGLGAILLIWETGRLNGDLSPWNTLWPIAGVVVATLVAAVARRRRVKEKKLLPQKRALEALRAKLDEKPNGS
jgi:hypothetical protein